MEKKHAQRAHTKRRLQTRFGTSVNHAGYRQLVFDIQEGRAKFLGRQTDRVSLFLITHEGKEMKALYDKKRGTIVTVLPTDWPVTIRGQEAPV